MHAVAVAGELSLSAPAVRRHLDALLEAGEAEVRDAPGTAAGGGAAPPASTCSPTPAGPGSGTATTTSRSPRSGSSPRTPATRRSTLSPPSASTTCWGPAAAQVRAAGAPQERVAALAGVLAARGYAAQIREVGSGRHRGVQLCQHHCPIAHVATEFPQLCEAETRAFAELLGTHVQRLATIARGDAACTTHVPLEAPERPDSDRSATRRSPAHSVRGGPPGVGSTHHHIPPTAAERQGGSPHDDRS